MVCIRCGLLLVTVPLYKRKVFIIGSCPILVLSSVLGPQRRADDKTGVKNYQWPASQENVIRKYLRFLNFIVIMA